MRVSQRDPNKYYVFHKDISHWTKKFRHLKQEIEQILSKGHLGDVVNRDRNKAPRKKNRGGNP